MIEVAVDGLVHDYPGGTRALDGVTLRVGPGELLALVGQNGSGKTTLVRHLNGLLRPTAGQVRVGGMDVSGRRVAELAAQVGLVFQDPDRQIFSGTVRAEVEFGARNVGLRGERLDAAVGAALEAVGLSGAEATNPYDLGGSRRKLLAVASVLAMDTPVLVLDEPTTGQDRDGVARIRQVVARAIAAGRTVIAVSHDLRFVAETFERILVLRAGQVVIDDTPERAFGSEHWGTLRSTGLEPPTAAVLAHRLGFEGVATEEALVAALAGQPGPGA
ncbi:MAG: energy-coupling factor ABC transporter ATP-binding protein [Candidatus Limnocylindria bacterium]